MKLPEYTSLKEKKSYYISNTIEDIDDFNYIWNNLSDFFGFNANDICLYRGMHEARYKLFTSAQREWITNEYNKSGIDFCYFIQSIIDNIRSNEILSNYYKSLGVSQNDLLYLSLLQHYGAPAPLLDFTYNKNVALYFALEDIKNTPSNSDIDDYVSIYIIKKPNMVDNFVDIVQMLFGSLKKGIEHYEELRKKYPNYDIDATQIEDVDKYTSWINKETGKKNLADLSCGFLDNPLHSNSILRMYKTNEALYWSNMNILAQDGCFAFYTDSERPLEQYFSESQYLTQIICLDIRKSLADNIRENYLSEYTKQKIFPDPKSLCREANNQFCRKMGELEQKRKYLTNNN